MGQITSNAVAWAHFRLSGGLKMALIATGAYLMIAMGIIAMVVGVGGEDISRALANTAPVLLGVQLALMGGLVSLGLCNTIQNETKSRMMESHRLLPISPCMVILGYVAGAAAMASCVTFGSFCLGLAATAGGGLPVAWWLLANVVALVFCAFVWVVVASAAMIAGHMGTILCLALLGGVLSQGTITYLVPGLGLLLSPIFGRTIFSQGMLDAEKLPLYALSIVVQLAVAMIFLRAASRRYLDPEATAFTGPLGLLLTALFLASSAIAFQFTADLLPRRMGYFRTESACIGTFLGTLILCFLTICSHVGAEARASRPRHRQAIRDAGLVLALLACLSVLGLLVPDVGERLLRLALTLLTVALFCLQVLFWSRAWLVRTGKVLMPAIMLVIAMMNLLPVFVGAMLRDVDGTMLPAGRTILQSSSFASLAVIWSDRQVMLTGASLIGQLILTALPMSLLVMDIQSKKRKAALNGISVPLLGCNPKPLP